MNQILAAQYSHPMCSLVQPVHPFNPRLVNPKLVNHRLGFILAVSLVVMLWHDTSIAQSVALAPSITDLKKLSIEELLDIEVTSVSRAPQKLSEAASSVQVITQDDIHRSGATSLPEALRLASNLQVVQKNSHDWGISARGFNTELNNKMLVMIDGRTVYTPLFSGVFWNAQDYLLADIDHIEVISGPGGTLWGANAVNGVINIITKQAKDTQGLYVEAGGGTLLQDFAGVRYGGKLTPDADFRVYGKYFDRSDETLPNDNAAGDAWHMYQAGFRIDASPTTRNQLSLQGDTYSGSDHVPAGGIAKNTGINVLGRWSHTVTDDSAFSLQVYYDHTHLDDPVPAFTTNNFTLAPAGMLTDDLDTYDVDFQHRVRVGTRNRVVWGLGYRHTHDVVSNAPALAFLPPQLNHSLYSGFLQDEIALRDNMSVIAGTKLEHNDYTGWEVEPNIRLQWQLNPRHMLWSAVSRAVRTPSRVDRDLSEPAPPNLVVLKGSSDFISETVVAYELGYRMQAATKLVSSIAAFYNDYQHIRSTSITPATLLPFYFANNLHGETYGVELTGTYQVLSWWQVRFGYNPFQEHLRVVAGQFDLSNAHNETADPQQRASLRSAMDLPHRITLDAGLRWVDNLHINNGPAPGIVPSYIDMDMRLGWQLNNKFEIAIIGQNLLHAHHAEYGYPSAARIEVGRNVVGKIVWRL